jgi:hypothetical protein
MQQKYNKWVRWIETICAEVEQLCHLEHIFLEVQEIIYANPSLPNRNSFYGFLNHGYTALGVMGVRRQVKQQKDSISLASLLNDIQDNPEIISLQKFKSLYGESIFDRELAESHFNGFKAPDADHVNPDMVNQDLASLRNSAQGCEKFADRKLAHSDSRTVEPHPTFNDLHACIDLIEELALKYRLILTAKGGDSLTPVILGNWKVIFEVPWGLTKELNLAAARDGGRC